MHITSDTAMISAMAWLSVSEAAERLGLDVSRVRALAHAGEIDAQRVGSRWIIDEGEVARFAAAREHRRGGRPFQPRASWALLALAGGRPVDWVSAASKERLLGALRSRSLANLVGQLRRRAVIERWYVHPSLVDRLAAEEGVVIGGARASGALSGDASPLEIYIRAGSAPRLRKAYSPAVDPDEHNVIVRLVDEVWPFEPGEEVAWPVVAAVDLLEGQPEDPRARAVAERILRRVDA